MVATSRFGLLANVNSFNIVKNMLLQHSQKPIHFPNFPANKFLVAVTKSICTAPWTLHLTFWKYWKNKCLYISVYLRNKLLSCGGPNKFYKAVRCWGRDDNEFFSWYG